MIEEPEYISKWDSIVPIKYLDPSVINYIRALPEKPPPVEWIWGEMNHIWDQLQLTQDHPIDEIKLSNFYSHPIWLVNAMFTEADLASRTHRILISDYIASLHPKSVLDFGGGGGYLAQLLRDRLPDTEIFIVEPFPSPLLLHKINNGLKIHLLKGLEPGMVCDIIVAQDVLEHIPNPLECARDLISATKLGGICIFANSFYPMIKCHLPTTFYLRHTFEYIVKFMGLKAAPSVNGVSHAKVFQKVRSTISPSAKLVATIAKLIGPPLNSSLNLASRCLNFRRR